MVAKLVAEEGILKGLVLSLEDAPEWVIGRDPESSQILLEDPSVSRKHILVRSTPEGIVLENLSETNPVQVNDETVVEPKILNNGDALRIGGGIYRFYTESAAQLIDTPTEDAGFPLINPQETDSKIPMNAPSPQLSKAPEEEKHDSIFDEDASDEVSLAQINFDLPGNGRWLLKVIGGPNNGAEFLMQADHSYTLGTDANSCDLVFHDNSVSRQQARISVTANDELFIEDLKSRNGTLADGEPIHEKQPLVPNSLITMGTTTFIVYDREGEMQTIISPLLPSIVKVLQQKEEDKKREEEKAAQLAIEHEAALAAAKSQEQPKESGSLGPLILIGTITGLFVLIGLGTTTLFKSEPVLKQEQVDMDMILQQALSAFPSIKYTFNKNTGNLLLVGHVLRGSDKAQLMYNLQGLRFIRNIDDSGVIIDEYVWREISPIFTRNPAWGSVSIHSPTPGKFVLSGYLQTRKQSEQLWDYLSSNFPYLDLLERKIVVEEDVISSANSILQREGLKDVSVTMSNGELSLSGFIVSGKEAIYTKLLNDLREIPGVRDVKSFVAALPPEASIINISDRYEVTGVSNQGQGNISVVINGRILSRGDVLDGMTITSIKGNSVFLEKDNTKYRIDFSR